MQSLSRVLAIAWKEILVLVARPMERRIIIVPPVLLMFLLSWAATREVKNIDAAILDQDHGVWSLALRQELEGSPSFRSVLGVSGMAEAREALDMQRVLFVLVLADDFSRRIAGGREALVQIILDGRRPNAAQIAQAYMNGLVMNLARDTPGYAAMRANGAPLVRVESVNWFNPNLESAWFYLPSMIGLLSMMMGFVISGLSVAREREMGTFDQILVSPAHPAEIALAKLIPGGLVAGLHGSVLLLGSYYIFQVPLEGSLLLLYGALFLFALAVSGIGLMISSLVSTQQQAFLGSFTVAVPFILLSGFASPVDNMPLALRWLGEADPLRHFLTLIQGVFLKDISMGGAMINLVKIGVIATVTTAAAILMFRKQI